MRGTITRQRALPNAVDAHLRIGWPIRLSLVTLKALLRVVRAAISDPR